MLATAYGIMWSGVRDFQGHPMSAPLMLAGAAISLIACQVEIFYAAPVARSTLMSAIVVVHSALSAWETTSTSAGAFAGRKRGAASAAPLNRSAEDLHAFGCGTMRM
jgi:hypothetical protein